MRVRILILSLLVMLLVSGGIATHAQTRPNTDVKPFILPMNTLSGPSTWLMGQPYGNTTGAFINGANSYSRGQYLHFGVDISMPCGTPLVAVADAVVHSVDNPNRGSAPHNLLLQMPELGITVLYGHLLERPNLTPGQTVQQGEVVALSGEPESNCNGRTHLHLEVRSYDQTIAYNPILFIDAPWHSMVGMGGMGRALFQQDLNNARRWMTLEDQPDVRFGGNRLNNYTLTYPPSFNRSLTAQTQPDRPYTPISQTWELRQIGNGGCCPGMTWHPSDANRLYFVDGMEGQVAGIYEFLLDSDQPPTLTQSAPPAITSADGTFEIIYERQRTTFRRLADNMAWTLEIPGVYPVLSPDNTLLLWTNNRQVWVAALDGSFSKVIYTGTNENPNARWLDNTQVLVSERQSENTNRLTNLSRVHVTTDTVFPLGTWHNVRNMQVAPGGRWAIFYSAFNPDPINDGAYLLNLEAGSAQKLPWFADFRWRDSESVFYITFNPLTDIQQLHFYHAPTGESYPLTDADAMPFTIANAEWSVAPDGNAILFRQASDSNIWLLQSQVGITAID